MASLSKEIILTSSPEGPIIAYDASTGTTLAHFTGSRSPRRGLTLAGKSLIAASHISSSSSSVAASSDGGSGSSIHLYRWWSSTPYHQVAVPEPVAPIAATPDGSYLFAGGLSGYLHIIILPSGDIVKSFPVHYKPISCLEIIDDGSLLFSGGDDGSIVVSAIFKLTNVSQDEYSGEDFILYRVAAHSAPVTAIKCSFGRMTSCSLDCTCKFWCLSNGVILLRTVVFPCGIFGMALDTMESQFYAAGSDGLVYSGHLVMQGSSRNDESELVTWAQKYDGGAILSVAVVNEGRNLVSASEEGCVWVWDIKQGHVTNILGNNQMMAAGGISDLVVAREIGGGGGGGSNESGHRHFGATTIRELSRNSSVLGGVRELGEVLNDVAKEKNIAIDMLESAIGMYERLLQLILKEAKECSSTSSKSKGKEKDKI